MKQKNIPLFALSAALLLSACNTDKAATTTSDTSAVTEEVTTTTETVAVTPAEETTTVSVTTGDRIVEVRAMMQKHIDEDGYIGFEFDMPTAEEKMKVLEKHFYGVWELEGHDPIVFTYDGKYYDPNKDCEQYEYYTDGGTFTELDDRYICPRINGGAGECYVIYKSDPETLYYTAAMWVNDDENNRVIGIHSGTDEWKYKRTQKPEPVLDSRTISYLGMMKLEALYGEEFSQKLEETLKRERTDKYGMAWKYSWGCEHGLPPETWYLLSLEENRVELAVRFFDRSALWEYTPSAELPDSVYYVVDMRYDGRFWRDEKEFVTAYPYIFPDDVGIKVKAPDKTITLSVKPVLDLAELTNDYGIEMISDYRNDEIWQLQKEYIEERYKKDNEEAENYFKETLDDWKKRDYFNKPTYSCGYAGTEMCDYVICKRFGFTEVVQLQSYEIFIFIKDGKIVGNTPMLDRSGMGMYIDGNDLFGISSGDMLHIDLRTGKYDYISSQGWDSIPGINDDWVIFGNGQINAYDRHTGEIITPEPKIEWCGLDTFLMRLNGNRIEYTKHGHPNGGWYYDLETGETGEAPELYSGMDSCVYESDLFIAKSYYNMKNGDSGDFSKLSITRKSDGLEKLFDFTGLIDPSKLPDYGPGSVPAYLWWGDWFITYVKGIQLIGINFETDETANIVLADQKSLGTYLCGDRYMSMYSNNGNYPYTLFGEVIFEIE